MSVLFTFPGQGAQRPGMLHGLPDHPETARTVSEARAILDDDPLALDTAEALASSYAVQLCLLIAGVATARVLIANDARPHMVVGLSIGAYPAAVIAGSLDYGDALRLVARRGRLMEQAYPRGYGMAAVVGLDRFQIESLITHVHADASPVYLANLNAERQMVVSGAEGALRAVMQLALDQGATKVERLAVNVPSHCPLLDAVAVDMAISISGVIVRPPTLTYLSSNVARALFEPARIADDLARNMARQVHWHDTARLATSGTSNIGFRGTEPLGGDLKAIFQVENAIPLDGDLGPNTWASRNSNVGLAGSWGTVFFGNWDTPYKWAALQTGYLRGLTSADYSNTFQSPGFRVPVTTTQSGGTSTSADAAFNRRQGNSVQYWSPKWAGFSFRIDYSANEGKTTASAAVPSISPELYSGSLEYANGPVIVRYGYEQHKDYFGLAAIAGPTANAFGAAGLTLASNASNANPSSKDEGNELIVIYQLANVKLSAAYERLKYRNDDTTPGKVNEYERDAWYVIVQPRFGSHQVWLLYGQAKDGDCSIVGGAACSTGGLGAKEYAIGYSYDLSKRTTLFAQYYGVNNDGSASYGIFPTVPAGAAGNGATPVGADSRGFGVGMQHIF